MKVLIVEDEKTAIDKLEYLLQQIDPEINIVGILNSVHDTISWIRTNEKPDLGFFDIQLSDDNSFQIFEHCNVDFPIVFVTAFDDYLLKAFEVNSIHYLLKPINEEKVRNAIHKMKVLDHHFSHQNISSLLTKPPLSSQHQRIIARKGIDFIPLSLDEIAYFFTEHKLTFVRDKSGSLLMVDQNLTELEDQLDPLKFFRVNRQYIIQFDSILRFRSSVHGKVEIEVEPPTKEKIAVAKEKAKEFRSWISKL